jgi:hypothetical protein
MPVNKIGIEGIVEIEADRVELNWIGDFRNGIMLLRSRVGNESISGSSTTFRPVGGESLFYS